MKSVAVSEDRMGGQPLGDSAVARCGRTGPWCGPEEGIPAQHFHIPVFEVEGLMLSYGRGIYGRLIVRCIRYRGVDGRLVVGASAIVKSERVVMLMDGD